MRLEGYVELLIALKIWKRLVIINNLNVKGYTKLKMVDLLFWLLAFGLNGPLRQYFSLYRAVSQREGERGEKG